MAVIDFVSVWQKTVDYINNKWKDAGMRADRTVSEEYMDAIVRDFLNDLESAFAREYESRFRPRIYPFAGLISESRVTRYKTADGFDYIISFGGSDGELSRQSLLIKSGRRKGARTGRGIKNIISLFDTGFSHDRTIFGLWESRSRGATLNTRASNHLDGFALINDYVEEFKRNNEQFGITAKLIAPAEYYAR